MADIIYDWDELEELPNGTVLMTFDDEHMTVYHKWQDRWDEAGSDEYFGIQEREMLLPAKVIYQPDGESYPQGKSKPEPVRDVLVEAVHQRSNIPVWDEGSNLTGQHVCVTCYAPWPCGYANP